MTIDKTIQLVKKNQPNASTSILNRAYELFQKLTKDYPFIEKKKIQAKALEMFFKTARENTQIEFICATLFFDIKIDNQIFHKIEQALTKEISLIVKSYWLAKEKLKNNQELFEHSFRTAFLLAKVKMSANAICTALLHELIQISPQAQEEIKNEINPEVAKLCVNLDKIKNIKVADNEKYIQALREMVIAMADDLQVIIIKMATNIDCMKYELFKSPEEMKNLALESMEILSPIADLLGMWRLRWQMEDYAFRILEPENHNQISIRFNVDERKNRDKYIQKTKTILEKSALKSGISCEINGRFKHFYSIHKKMQTKKKSFNEICDVFALRIIVDSIDECYRVLGIIHNLWEPKQRRFKDYIASPKNNNYQSLHTTVFGLNNRLTEFQIRTKEMNETAQYGIAAHWYYKNPARKVPDWIQELLTKQKESTEDQDFLTKFNSELLANRIYVYTPRGDVISLPENATPIDFAYAIHTEIGHKCTEAIVNDLPVPLNYKLDSNDIIQIITDRTQPGPKTEWLEFIKTPLAKKKIENYFNK